MKSDSSLKILPVVLRGLRTCNTLYIVWLISPHSVLALHFAGTLKKKSSYEIQEASPVNSSEVDRGALQNHVAQH